MAGENWSDTENDLIVADYFAMLEKDVTDQPYSKTEHRNRLVSLVGRSKGSIEFKHQNLSAVLIAFGQPWITGYKPAFNFQMSLTSAVERYLVKRGPPAFHKNAEQQHLAEAVPLDFRPAPTQRNAPPPEEAEAMLAIARKFDVAQRDERNRALGHAGEKLVLNQEKSTLSLLGYRDLADKVRWTSKLDGDGAGYDIESFAPDGKRRLIEVKTTNGWDRTPFHISRNELRVGHTNRDEWLIMRLYDFARAPKVFELRPPLDRHVELTATHFQANFH